MKIQNFPAQIEHWESVLEFLESNLEGSAMSAKMQFEIIVSAEEIFTNIASYAYGTHTDKGETVEISCGTTQDAAEFQIRFRDWGIAYNPLERPDPDFNIPFEERRVGGLGIYMVKNFMDHVEYRYEDGCNIFTIGKKL